MGSFNENARKINEFTDRINATFKTRDRDEKSRDRWLEACRDFHRQYNSLAFSACYDLDGGLRHGSQAAIDASIAFLLADPYYFRSGYVKEYIWKYLPSCKLSEDQIEKVEFAATAYLDRILGREFWYMCRAMARIARSQFWDRLERESATFDPEVKVRASYLYAYRDDLVHGEKVHRAVRRKVLMDTYGRR